MSHSDIVDALLAGPQNLQQYITEYHSLSKILDLIGNFDFLPPDYLIPINELSKIREVPLSKITNNLFLLLLDLLKREIDKNPDCASKVLISLKHYISNPQFFPIFNTIAEKIPSIPSDFLIELNNLPISKFKQIFENSSSMTKIFQQCHPLFNRCVIDSIFEFLSHPEYLDSILASTSAQDESYICGIHEKICHKTISELYKYCGNYQFLYDEICRILFDLFCRNHNPLIAALRLEFAQWIPNDVLKDSHSQFVHEIFSWIKTQRFDKNVIPPHDDETILIGYDPMLRRLCFRQLKKQIEDHLKRTNGTIDEKIPSKSIIIQQLIIPLLASHLSPNEATDLINYATILKIFSMMHKHQSPYNDTLFDGLLRIKKNLAGELDPEKVSETHQILLYVTYSAMRQDQDEYFLLKILEMESNSQYKMHPDFAISYKFLTQMAMYGINEPIFRLMINWAKQDKIIRLYVLSLMLNVCQKHKDDHHHNEVIIVWKFFNDLEHYLDENDVNESSILESLRVYSNP